MSAEDGKFLMREDELRDISDIPEVQQGLYAPDKPSLLGRMKEGVSDIAHKVENVIPHGSQSESHHKSLFEKLNDGLSSIATTVSNTIHGSTEKPENTPVLGGIDYQVKLAQELESGKDTVKSFGRKLSTNLENYKDSGDMSSETTITPNRTGPSTLDKIDEKYGKVADKIAGTFDSLKDKVIPSRDTDTNVSQRGEDSDSTMTFTEQRENLSLEAPTHQINPAELKDFHEVKTGINETVSEYKHDHRVEELGGKEELVSSNPFDALSKVEEAEPTEEETPTRSFGGDITNKVLQPTNSAISKKPIQDETESKGLIQSMKEGVANISTSIADAVGHLADKTIGTMEAPEDKENLRQTA